MPARAPGVAPQPAAIPAGIGTVAGLSGSATTLALAAVALFTDRSAESIGAFGSAAAILVATVLGRMLQARESIRAQGAGVTVVNESRP
jgi:hypothetical protein